VTANGHLFSVMDTVAVAKEAKAASERVAVALAANPKNLISDLHISYANRPSENAGNARKRKRTRDLEVTRREK
jgi:hypothetical protein